MIEPSRIEPAKIEPARPHEEPRGVPRALAWRQLLLSVIAGGVIPTSIYLLLRSRSQSEVFSLTAAGAIPAGWTALRWLWRRQFDWIGILSTAGFVIAVSLSLLFGGTPLLLKVREAPILGILGIVALLSVAVRRPLLGVVLRLMERPLLPPHLLAQVTAIFGVLLVANAATAITLAVLLPTPLYLAMHHLIGWTFIGIGVLILLRLKKRARLPQRSSDDADFRA